MGSKRGDETVPFVHDPLVGTILGGQYRVLHRLRRGGFGDRYLAQDVVNTESMAVELMHRDLCESVLDDALHAIPGQALVHRNIVPVVDSGRCPDGRVFFAMPWLERAIDCTTVLEHCGPQDPELVAGHLEGAAEGLSAIHRAGRAHGDVKPSNIVLADVDGLEESLIVDSAFAAKTSLLSRAQGAALGTPRYLAPECARGEDATAVSDVYSLAVVAFEQITGTPPFDDDHPAYVLAKKLAHAPPRLRDRTPQPIAPHIEELFMHALARDVTKRPRTCTELIVALAA